MDADGDAEGDTEERVADLEDALDELKAEFEKMMMDKGDEKEEESLEAPITPETEVQPMEGKHKEDKKEKMDEYKIQKSADTADHADSKASPVASQAKSLNGANASELMKSGEEKGRPAPTPSKTEGDFANTGGKDSLKTTEVKADHKDGADASGKKSPIVAIKK